MKKILFTLSAMAAMMTTTMVAISCSSSDDEPQNTAQLFIDAVKGDYPGDALTRTLSESGSGIAFTWEAADKTTVYTNGWGKKLGELSPTTGNTGNAKTKLDGSVSSEGVKVGDQLMLISPRDEWSYTGQDGTLASISTKYDYSTASAQVLYIDGENNNKIYASNAIFNPEQAVIKFVLKNSDGSADLPVPSLTIISNSGKLVQKCSLNGAATNYGNLVIAPATGTTNTFYVALRNDQTGADSYTLSVSTGNTVYSYTKSDATFTKGKFKTVTVRMKDMNDTYTERTGYDNEGNESWE